ncbi:MAG: hypothetical protein ABSH50_26790 [Bryobacteraceae bacterium]
MIEIAAVDHSGLSVTLREPVYASTANAATVSKGRASERPTLRRELAAARV